MINCGSKIQVKRLTKDFWVVTVKLTVIAQNLVVLTKLFETLNKDFESVKQRNERATDTIQVLIIGWNDCQDHFETQNVGDSNINYGKEFVTRMI